MISLIEKKFSSVMQAIQLLLDQVAIVSKAQKDTPDTTMLKVCV